MKLLVSSAENSAALFSNIWREFAPDAVAVHAGVHVVKNDGAPFLHYTLAALLRSINRLQGRYGVNPDAGNFIGNWLHGVDLYYFDRDANIGDYLRDEQSRYFKRAKLAKKIRAVRRAITRYDNKEKQMLESALAMAKRATVKERQRLYSLRDQTLREIDSKRKVLYTKLARLTKELYITDEF